MQAVGRTRAVLAAGLLAAFGGASALASSHREAPIAAMNAESDLTDVYIFRSPDNPNNVVMIMGVWPFSDPAGAPNYTQFGYDTIYQFNIDNDGDSRADITWQYAFNVVNGRNIMDPAVGTLGATGVFGGKNTFLYNTAPITISSGTGSWNIVQTANVKKVIHTNDAMNPEDPNSPRTVEYDEDNRIVGPEFIGPHSNPNGYSGYESLITHVVNGEKHYFGPRDDPFWVDLPGIFDLIGLRGLQTIKPAFTDSVLGWNIMAIVLEVPIDNVVTAAPGACSGVTPPANICTVGFWATTYQAEFDSGLKIKKSITGGTSAQISRLGMPLFNEVVVPLPFKDAYNNLLTPDTDIDILAQVGGLNRAFKPELATLLGPQGPSVPNTALRVLPKLPTGNVQDPPFTTSLESFSTVRCDIVQIFTSGVPGVNARTDGWKLPQGLCGETGTGFSTKPAGEMLRINLSTPVTPGDINSQDRLGLLGTHTTGTNVAGDLDGFPNGRRLGDDVVDIELQVVAGVLADEFGDNSCPECSGSPYDVLSDAIGLSPALGASKDFNDKLFLNEFPYLAQPHNGYNHDHEHNGFGAAIASAVIGIQSIALAGLVLMMYRRRQRAKVAAV